MPKRVFKYTLKLDSELEVMLPKGAKVLHFGNQYERLTLWAEVCPDAPLTKRYFRVIGTGHEIPDEECHYIGSAIF